MPYIIRGWNHFYEGWLANCLEQSLDNDAHEDWKGGWRMGHETGETKMLALGEELRRDDINHITVERINE